MTMADREALTNAVKSLEHPGLAARLTNLIGKPVELIGYALPLFASKAIASATSMGLEAALKVALRTLPRSPRTGAELLHRALAMASGAGGRHVWFSRTSGRVAGIHHDYVAIDRRHSAKRGRGFI
jgi:hypothetical protein